MEKPAPTEFPVHDLIRRRWSPRAIDPTRLVEREKLLVLLEAARWAPSCFNEQPWHYLVFEPSNAAVLEEARSCLVEGNRWAKSAPVLLLSVAKETFTRNGKPNRHAHHDVGLASENLVLQAVDVGLTAHQMAGFDAEKARQLFGIPEGFTPMAMIALGYAPDPQSLADDVRKLEEEPRTRKPMIEWAHDGHWSKPMNMK